MEMGSQIMGGTTGMRPSKHVGPRRAAVRRVAVVPGALVALASLAAACGSSSSSSASAVAGGGTAKAAAAVRNAPVATTQAGTAQVAVKIQTNETSKGTGRLGLSMLGAFDFATQVGTVEMSVTGLAAGTSSPNLHLVFSGSSLYLQATGQLAQFGQGKPWVSIAPSSLSQLFAGTVSGSAVGPLASAITGDPLSALGVLDTTALTAAPVGTRQVGGVTTTEYDVTIDPVAAARQATGNAKQLFKSMGTKPVALQVWLDHAGRLVELQAAAPGVSTGSASSGSAGTPVGVTVRLSGFGSPVSVTVPPPSEVAAPPTSGTSAGSS